MPFGVLPDKIYLGVPYSEKDEAKKNGAQFDFGKYQWYISSNNPKALQLQKMWPINQTPIINLVGEDRNYGGDKLFIDMIPITCWYNNVRRFIHPCDWDRLRRYVYERVNYRCECCNINTKTCKDIQIEAHERWHYDNDKKIQKLMRIIALCNRCHTTTHMGFAELNGKGEDAMIHLKYVRNFNDKEAIKHKKEAKLLWYNRNEIKWKQDMSLITNNGIKLNIKQ
tara:strand:- start:426 stop:1100 length:675 start_codon:yes stop_codon:yes gene_type:complete